ncbi:MAG: hypothetical protein IPM36_24590 [Lewinellaceae bacterium]|nr:hypothetical protein [Lewinellaceae bacterium]
MPAKAVSNEGTILVVSNQRTQRQLNLKFSLGATRNLPAGTMVIWKCFTGAIGIYYWSGGWR